MSGYEMAEVYVVVSHDMLRRGMRGVVAVTPRVRALINAGYLHYVGAVTYVDPRRLLPVADEVIPAPPPPPLPVTVGQGGADPVMHRLPAPVAPVQAWVSTPTAPDPVRVSTRRPRAPRTPSGRGEGGEGTGDVSPRQDR